MVAYRSGLCCFSGSSGSWNVSFGRTVYSYQYTDGFSALHYEKIVQNEHFVRLCDKSSM
jgi:hypothetical protein